MRSTRSSELCGVAVGGTLRDLRRLLYCGEWIESHVLHIGFLHAPDFLGYHSGIAIAADHPEMVESILTLKKTGNDLVELLGGRPIHPVNVRLGGFYRAPSRHELETLRTPLEEAREICIDLIRWTAGFDFPDLSQDYEFVSLRHPDEYPFNEGRIVSNKGLDIDASEFEESLGRGTRGALDVAALPARRAWLVPRRPAGPVRQQLRPAHRRRAGPGAPRSASAPVVTNPFKSIVVRGLETLYAIDEALRIIDSYTPPDEPFVEVPARAGVGWAATEAPRGLLYHRYEIDDERHDPRRADHPADRAEPADDRIRSPSVRQRQPAPRSRRSPAASASRRSGTTTRASRARPTS